MSHSAKGRDILNLCCVGHYRGEIFKSAECPLFCCLRKSSSQKLRPESVAPEFSSADAKIHATRLPRLSFLVLHLSQSPKRVPSKRELEFHAPHSRAISVPYIVPLPRSGIGTNCCLSCTPPFLKSKRDNPTPPTLPFKLCSNPHTSVSTTSFKLYQPKNTRTPERGSERPTQLRCLRNKMTIP
jgi:hypothetical protein